MCCSSQFADPCCVWTTQKKNATNPSSKDNRTNFKDTHTDTHIQSMKPQVA